MRLFVLSLVVSAICVLGLALTIEFIDDMVVKVLLVIAMTVLALGFLFFAIKLYPKLLAERRVGARK